MPLSQSTRLDRKRESDGFTLVELIIVVVVIGLLTTFAVPRFMNSVERTKAMEAYNYLSKVQAAQARYHARLGRYADDVRKLDGKLPSTVYFRVGAIAVPATASSLDTGWELVLTRSGPSAGYGAYRVVFDDEGFDKLDSTIPDAINPFRSL